MTAVEVIKVDATQSSSWQERWQAEDTKQRQLLKQATEA